MLTVPKSQVAKPVSDQRLADRFPQFQEELSELEAYLVRVAFGDESVQPSIKRIWTLLLPKLDEESKESIREAIIATIHSVLVPQDGNTEQRLLRNSQLLELMVFFLGDLLAGESAHQSHNL
jgi:hypothetical protein